MLALLLKWLSRLASSILTPLWTSRACRKKGIDDHDKKIFGLWDGLLTESFLMFYLTEIDNSEVMKDVFIERYDEMKLITDQIGNQFARRDLSKLSLEFKRQLDALISFGERNFFPRTRPETFCLFPRGNIDLDWDGSGHSLQYYRELSDQLAVLVAGVKQSYATYRLSIRQKLLL